MDALQPEVVVISNGTNRLYKYPRKVTIDRLQALPWNPDMYKRRAASRRLTPVSDLLPVGEPALEHDGEPFRRRARLTWAFLDGQWPTDAERITTLADDYGRCGRRCAPR